MSPHRNIRSTILSTLGCTLILFAGVSVSWGGLGPPPTACLSEDGEGLADGAPIPGWDVPIDPNAAGRTTVTAVTAATNPSAVHSGRGAIRVNGDFYLGKELDVICRGLVTVDYWHFPRPGSSTNSAVALYGTQGSSDEFLAVHKNDQDRWLQMVCLWQLTRGSTPMW